MAEKPTFVIGDVHGHWDRLAALLQAAEILGDCEACDGTGQVTIQLHSATGENGNDADVNEGVVTFDPRECAHCDGDGIVRVNHDVRVVQLGDLGHFGGHGGSPTGDAMCYEYADKWLDTVLWGNHDRALVDSAHAFTGYQHPGAEVKRLMEGLYEVGKLQMATTVHGYLVVHAGVHYGFKGMGQINDDVEHFAGRINALADEKLDHLHRAAGKTLPWPQQQDALKRFRLIDAIGQGRGGAAHEGGVLWMDWLREKHLQGDPFKYICGHTAQATAEEPLRDEWGNWCLDLGGKDNGRLAGLWLADGKPQETVQVNLNQ